MKKSLRITLIAVAVAVVVAAIVIGVVFGVKKPETPAAPALVVISDETSFAASGGMSVREYSDTVFELTSDLTLDYSEKTPIFGSVDKPFCGTLDGKGHTVKITYGAVPESGSVGLFGFIYGATVKNLNVELTLSGENVKLSDDATYIGAIAGFAYGDNYVENVSVSVTVAAKLTVKSTFDINGIPRSYSDNSQYVGGLFGYAAGKMTVKNCRTTAFSVNASDYLNDVTTDFDNEVRKALFVGGGFGHASGIISVDGLNVSLTGVNLYAKTVNFGGVAGVMEGGTLQNVTVAGGSRIKAVNTVKGYVGGVTGYTLNSTLTGYSVSLTYDVSSPVLCSLSFGGAAGFIDGTTVSSGTVSVNAELDYATAFGGLVGAVRNGKIKDNTLSGGLYGVGGQAVEISGLQSIITAKRAYYGTFAGRIYGASEVSGNTATAGYKTAPELVGFAEAFVPVDSEGNLGTPVSPVISGNTVSVTNG